MPQLLGDIVKEVVAREPDIEVVGEVANVGDGFGLAVERTRADVVLCRRAGSGLPDILGELFEEHPHLAVVAIDAGDRTGSVYQLRPACSPLDVRPQGLVDAIRSVGRSPRPFSWTRASEET
jgi:DNA-binding NarL/FixJ family response regulator